MEIWRDVIGYEGVYKVSFNGAVKSCGMFIDNRHGSKSFKKGRILKQHTNRKGYNQVKLCLNGVQKSFRVHRLVAESWVENPENKKQVNHKDGVKNNNHYLNLEWCTNRENVIHAYENNLIKTKRGEDHHSSILTNDQVIEIKSLIGKMKDSEIAKKFGVTQTTIYNIKKGIQWGSVK